MESQHHEGRGMSRESLLVFVKFGSVFVTVLLVMIVANSLVGSADGGAEPPWKTFNPTAADVHEGRQIMERNGCLSCHTVDGFGGQIGPRLNGSAQRKTKEDLFLWIKSPIDVKPGTRMPQYNLPDESILKIIGYLETKDTLQVQP